jgi:hypothetical protein
MGVLGESCGRMQHTYFFRSLADARGEELIAAVLQRLRVSLWKTTPRSFISIFKRRPPPPPLPVPDIEQTRMWTSTIDFGQPTEACYSAERRIVRAGGQDFELPDVRRTLVVLLDEDSNTPAGQRVVTVLLDVAGRPEQQQVPMDRSDIGRLRVERMRANQVAWRRALDADETIRAFFVERGKDGPAELCFLPTEAER